MSGKNRDFAARAESVNALRGPAAFTQQVQNTGGVPSIPFQNVESAQKSRRRSHA